MKFFVVHMRNHSTGEEWSAPVEARSDVDAFEVFLRRKYVRLHLLRGEPVVFSVDKG